MACFSESIQWKGRCLHLYQVSDGLVIPPTRTDWGNMSSSGQKSWYNTTTAHKDYIWRQWIPNPVFPVSNWSLFMLSVRTSIDLEGWPLECQGLPDRKSAFLPASHRAVQGGNRYPFDCPTSVWEDDEKRQQKKTNLLCFSFHFNFCKNFWRISYVQKLLILIKFNQVLIRFLCLSVEKFVHTIVFLWAFPSDVYLET